MDLLLRGATVLDDSAAPARPVDVGMTTDGRTSRLLDPVRAAGRVLRRGR